MSTGIVHQPDTPASSGSPASLDNGSKHDLVELHGGGSRTCSPVIEEECRSDLSGSPSRSPVTPNLSFTPPTNGILTPPNDGDGLGMPEPIKAERGAGRLKFYKDGVLCLELSHRDEGEKRKWVQIRTKTVFPTVVHTKKEVVIPRQISPTSIQSPLSVIHGSHHRVESSASQTSEDGSSMLSSPRVRESCWRKSVPHKAVSVNVEFYLRPASCVYLNRQSVPLRLRRRPFYPAESIAGPRTQVKCVCNSDAGNNNVGDTLNAEKSLAEGEVGDVTPCDQRRLPPSGKLKSKATSCEKSKRPSLSTIVDKLTSITERNLCFLKSKPVTSHSYDKVGNDFIVLPKKRTFKETDFKDFSSGTVRPAKISPKQKTVKTILNIPGFKSDPVKRGPETNGSELSPPPQGSAGRKAGKHEGSKKFRSSPQCTTDAFSPSSNKSDSPKGSLCLSSLTPDQQQYFTQQTMSKAISYTINSLLSPQKSFDTSKKAHGRPGLGENSSSMGREVKASGHHHPGRDSRSNSFGKSDLDQNSFLRHLLDTSDPIPKTPVVEPKVEATEIRHKQQSQRNSSGQNHSQSKSKDKESRTKSPMTDKSKERHLQELGGNLNNAPPGYPNNMPMNLFPPSPFMSPSSFFGPGGFPIPMQAYESLFSGRNINSALAAAAAELQYQQSLITPNMLQMQFNPAVAAAMAANYMGASPTHPPSFPDRGPRPTSSSSTGSRHSVLSNRSESKNGHSSVSKRDSSPLPNGYVGSPGSIPVPFHIPTSDGRIRSGSFSSTSSFASRSPRTTLPSTSDHNDDMPLNLSKKT